MTDNALVTFDNELTKELQKLLMQEHARLAQVDREKSSRSTTAKNYDVSINALVGWLLVNKYSLPTGPACSPAKPSTFS